MAGFFRESERDINFFARLGHGTCQIYPLMCINVINPPYFAKKITLCHQKLKVRICYQNAYLLRNAFS